MQFTLAKLSWLRYLNKFIDYCINCIKTDTIVKCSRPVKSTFFKLKLPTKTLKTFSFNHLENHNSKLITAFKTFQKRHKALNSNKPEKTGRKSEKAISIFQEIGNHRLFVL